MKLGLVLTALSMLSCSSVSAFHRRPPADTPESGNFASGLLGLELGRNVLDLGPAALPLTILYPPLSDIKPEPATLSPDASPAPVLIHGLPSLPTAQYIYNSPREVTITSEIITTVHDGIKDLAFVFKVTRIAETSILFLITVPIPQKCFNDVCSTLETTPREEYSRGLIRRSQCIFATLTAKTIALYHPLPCDMLLMYELIIARHITQKWHSIASSPLYSGEITDEIIALATLIEAPSIIEDDLSERLGLSATNRHRS